MSNIVGILFGWKRRDATGCVVLTLKVLDENALNGEDAKRIHLAISDEKLCALARDFSRFATERGLVVSPKQFSNHKPHSMLERMLAHFSLRYTEDTVRVLPAPNDLHLSGSDVRRH
jgi:hypothetical protein